MSLMLLFVNGWSLSRLNSERRHVNLRHLRCFIAVAEELHFGRAARRLHMEQSPLSRTIRGLETDLGVMLLERTPRIALSDDIGQMRLSALLALCREEAPGVGIRLFETPLTQLVSGLNLDLYDVGFALTGEVDPGVVAMPVWQDPLVVAVPARHPLLAHKQVPLEEVVSYPLVLCHPQVCEGCNRQLERLLRTVEARPVVAEYVKTHALMLALVAAGYGVGFSSAAHLAACRQTDVIARPLANASATLTTYLLRPERDITEPLQHFIERVQRVGHIPHAERAL